MERKEKVDKEENKLNESQLVDLPVADEQDDSTKGGAGLNATAKISTFLCPSDSAAH